MTRIAIIADSHFDEHSRFDECVRVHDWVLDDIERRGVDLIAHAGDVFERKSTPKERLAFGSWLQRAASLAPVIIVRGNHDAVGDLKLFADLETKHPVIVEEAAAVHVVGGVAVGCLAWPRRAELLALVGSEGREATEAVAGEALRNVIRGLGSEMSEHRGPRVLLAHAMVRGSVTSTGQPLVGSDLEIGLEDLDLANADMVALGHIHAGQGWKTSSGFPIAYPGSPRRATFGELEDKCYLIVDVVDGRAVVERVVTPSTPMVHADAVVDGDAGTIALVEAVDVAGAEVRLRYRVAADQQDLGKRLAADLKSKLLGFGAVDVKVEAEVIAITRARAPEVARAESLEEKLGAYWEAKNDVPDLDRSLRLVAKVRELNDAVPRSSGAGAPGRFLGLRARSMRPFRDVDLDFTQVPGPLVAITGDNGAGKSSLLELLTGAFYRTTPKHGSLTHMATARDAFLETRVWNGDSYTLRHLLDSVSKKSEAVALDVAGSPLTDSGKVREFDAWAERNLPSREVIEASTFAVQGRGGFLELGAAERKSVFLKSIGIERIESVAKLARERGDAAKVVLREAEIRRDGEADRSTRVEQAEEALALAEREMDGLRGILAAAESRVREAERAAEAQERACAERGAIEAQIETLDRSVLGAVRRRLASKALAERATQVAQAREEVVRLDRDLEAARANLAERKVAAENVERDRKAVATRSAERRDLQDRILVHTADLDTARADLAAQEGLASRAAEIEAAKLAVADLDAHATSLRGRAEAIRSSLVLAERADSVAGRDIVEAESERRSKEAELARLERELLGEAEVLASIARLEGELAEIGTLRAERTVLDERLTATRASLLTSKEDRIANLRRPLEWADAHGDDRVCDMQASFYLSKDDAARDQAEHAPDAIRADERALAELSGRIDAADRRAEATARVADRAPTMARAREEHASVLADLDGLLVHLLAAKEAATARQAELAVLRADLAGLDAEIRTTESDLAEQRRIAADADTVGRADVHARMLSRDIARLSTEREQAQASLADLPALDPVDAAEVEQALRAAEALERAVVTDLNATKAILVDADAIARASSEVEAAEREIERDERAIIELRAKLATIESTPPVDVDAAIETAQNAHAADRAAQGAVAKARSVLDLARESAARVAALTETVDAALAEVADWTRLSVDLGKDGLQALEVDAAGPELAAIANDLLHSCVSTRWTVDVRTQRQSADGKKTLEDCELMVLDTQEGREADGSEFSGGEKVLIGEAISLALSVFACRRLGVQGPTLVRDESGAALSPENGRRYIEMLRRAAATIGADKVIFVSHSPELQALADGRIHVGNGTARVVPVDFEPSRERTPAPSSTELFANAAE